MVRVDELKLRMKGRGYSIYRAAKVMGVDPSTLYRRMRGPDGLNIREILQLQQLLELEPEELLDIFFNEKSRKCDIERGR